jgi:hypothetical protein
MKPEIEAAIRDRWFVYHGLPFTFETEAGNPEALVRSLSFATDLSKKFNLPLPRDAKLTDMPDTWIHGYMSMPREMKSVRTLQKDIYSLELLNTLTNFWSGKKVNISPFIAAATEGVLLWDEHTFGTADESWTFRRLVLW